MQADSSLSNQPYFPYKCTSQVFSSSLLQRAGKLKALLLHSYGRELHSLIQELKSHGLHYVTPGMRGAGDKEHHNLEQSCNSEAYLEVDIQTLFCLGYMGAFGHVERP